MSAWNRISLAAAIGVVGFAPELSAQWLESGNTTILTLDAPQNADQFGWRVAVLGDADADEVADFAIASPFFDQGGKSSTGRVAAYSGRDGTLLWAKTGAMASSILGFALVTIGDLDGDAVREVVASAPFSDDGGKVYVWSGATGAVLRTIGIAGDPLATLGYSIATHGDFDGDGTEDLAIGQTGADTMGPNAGRVFVYFGPAHANAQVIDPPVGDSRFGTGLEFIPDLDGDGRDELAVTSRLSGDLEAARIRILGFDGSTHFQHREILGVNAGSALEGDRLLGAADFDGDGVSDLLVGEIKLGQAQAFSGATGFAIRAFSFGGGDSLGSGRITSDQDGDGVPDVLLGARGSDVGGHNAGRVGWFSGATGAVLRTLTGTLPDFGAGADVEVLGDLNADGEPELLIGGPATGNSPFKPRAWIVSGAPCAASWSNFGTGFDPAGVAAPSLQLDAPPVLGSSIHLLSDSSPSTTVGALLFVGPAVAAHLPAGGSLLAIPQIVYALPAPVAGLTLPFVVPIATPLCGASVALQLFHLDPSLTTGYRHSPGLNIVIGG